MDNTPNKAPNLMDSLPTESGCLLALRMMISSNKSQHIKKKIHMTRGYMVVEDKLLCEAWMEIGRDQIHGAEQKVVTYWKTDKCFHECRKFDPYI
jgi:hypothetical protein